MGARVREFEQAFAQRFGVRHAIMVNSGSSANLLGVAALTLRRSSPLLAGDEVLVPAVSWGTTYFPWHQYGLALRFVDVDPGDFCLGVSRLEEAITPRTKAIAAVNLLGAPCDFTALAALCERHGLVLLEDNCEAMGATLQGRHAGSFGALGTFSTFFSHHICTMEGGVVVTDDPELAQLITSLRAHGWTRDLPDDNLLEPKTGDPFADSYRFVLPGYNLRPTELAAALGLRQLAKLDHFLEARRRNASAFVELFGDGCDFRIQRPRGESSWFGFALVLQNRLAGRRRAVVTRLGELGVETRPIVAGNFARNPVVERMRCTTSGWLRTADELDCEGFFIGNHHYDIRPALERVRQVMEDLL
jgi:CDP-6-deoxy-D-xylo-4-hexulose-3-dehydrase